MSQMLSKESVNVNKKRWAAYAAAGVAATLAGTQSAEADVTHVVVGAGAGDLTIAGPIFSATLGTAGSTLLVGVQEPAGGPPNGVGIAAVIGGSVAGFFAGGFPYVSNVSFGANISTLPGLNGLGLSYSGTLAYGSGSGNDEFLNTGGYFAFTFNGGTQFGWTRLSVLTGAPANEYVLEEYAFTTNGETLTVGQTAVPEPTSLGLLALGAIGVMANRRRKKDA